MKNDYRKDYFWIKKDEFGKKHYYFNTDKGLTEVDREVYSVCFYSYLKISRDIKKTWKLIWSVMTTSIMKDIHY